jgi:hypothetical protein
MAGPSDSKVQNILPVQALFNIDNSFNTFIGQGQPFIVSATESIGIADVTALNATLYPTLSPVSTGQVTSLDVTSTKLTFNPSTGTLSATTFNGALSGTATATSSIANGVAGNIPYQTAPGVTSFITNGSTGQVLTSNGSSAPTWSNPTSSIAITDDTSTNATRYPLFSAATTGSISTEYTSSTRFQFNPSTGLLTATGFSGSGANLTNIPNGALTNSSVTIGSTSISLGSTATTLAGLTSVTSTTFVGALTGNASTATTATTATNATNIAITDDTSTATSVYPTFVTNTTGNLPAKTSSTKLSFVPSTGVLSTIGLVLTNALGVAYGGTGVTSSSGANSVVLRDANGNITTNCLFEGFTTQAASGTTITLIASSAQNYQITGSGGQVIKLPNATTLPNGALFTFNNNQSSGAITVQNNSSTTVATINSGGYVTVVLLDNSTAAGSWDRHDSTPSNVSWSTNTLDYAGSITSATWNGTAVAINRGGTGASTKATAFNALSPMSAAGDVIYGGTSGAGTALAIGTAGQVLTVNSGATAPQWSTPSSGTVTSVGGTGTVNGITLTGTVTSSGNLTLGGTLDLSSPPAIGGTTASTGRFTTVTSTVATGTAPFTVASTTPVTNLSIGGNAGTVTNGVYTTDTGTVTSTMLAGSIANAKLTNSSITFGSTAQALGSTVSGLSGVTIDNGAIGATTASTGKFTTLISTGTATLANGSTTYVQAIGDASYPGVYAAGGTNTPLVLQPLGTGALQAQKTDSGTTGGNARGANAVDWQTNRTAATQVASGQYSVVSGGNGNRSAGYASAIAGGDFNTATVYNAFIGSGNSNTVSGERSAIVGGGANTAAGYYNFIGAGFTNSGTSGSAVTTQSGTMNGTTAVTLSGSNASIKVGQLITGTSIASYTYVAAISGTSLTLSQNASGSSTSTLSFYTPHGVVVGGGNNQATGSYSFIGGGGDAGTAANRNVASGDWSTVGGGAKNTASGMGSVVCGGGVYASGGYSANTAGGLSSFIGSGWGNNASSDATVVTGGQNNTANGLYSTVVGGAYGTTRSIRGNTVFAASANPLSGQGMSQTTVLVLGKQTTDATATVITSDGSAASGTNQVILPNNSAYYFRGEIIAGVTGAGDTKGWYIEGVIKRGAGVGTTAIVGTATVTSLYADVGASTWAVTALADTTNGGLKITVTGQASTTIRWVAQIRTTEMTY